VGTYAFSPFISLTQKIRKGVNEFMTYVRLDFINLVIRSEQWDALMLLNNEAQIVSDVVKEQENMFGETCREFTGHGKGNSSGGQPKSNRSTYLNDAEQGARNKPPPVPVLRHGTSSTEETIMTAQIKQRDRANDMYTKCPISGRTSDFPLGFLGCMRCGYPGHAFHDCQDRNLLTAKEIFHENFNAHKAHISEARASREANQSGDTRPPPNDRQECIRKIIRIV
jgi:hypothetical protein